MEAEKKVVNLLLKGGVEVPVTAPLFLRFFRKQKRLSVKMPSLDVLIRISDLWLKINKQTNKELTLTEAFSLVSTHGKTVSKIIAWCVVNNPKKGWQVPIIAKRLRQLPTNTLMQLYQIVVLYGGLEDFTNTIRLIEATRITKPMNLSQEEQTS